MAQYFSPEGLAKLKKELEYLKNIKRKEVAERLKKAAAYGDLSENADYQDAKEEQAFVEGRILELEKTIKSAVVDSGKREKNVVQIGSTVILTKEGKNSSKEKFTIVGGGEADPLNGKISLDSPLGKALLNQSEGTTIEVKTPQGKIKYQISKITNS